MPVCEVEEIPVAVNDCIEYDSMSFRRPQKKNKTIIPDPLSEYSTEVGFNWKSWLPAIFSGGALFISYLAYTRDTNKDKSDQNKNEIQIVAAEEFRKGLKNEIDPKLKTLSESTDTKYDALNKQLGTLSSTVSEMSGKMSGLSENLGRLLDARLKQAKNESDSDLKKDLPQIAALMNAAGPSKSVNLDLVQNVGRSAIDIGFQEPSLIPAAAAFLEYATSIRENPLRGVVFDECDAFNYGSLGFLQRNNYPFSRDLISFVGCSKELIGNKESAGSSIFGGIILNTPKSAKWMQIRFDKPNGVKLDGLYLRNIRIFDSKIYYFGGPVLLENVYFSNCEFVLAAKKNSKGFALAALQSTSVNFESTGSE